MFEEIYIGVYPYISKRGIEQNNVLRRNLLDIISEDPFRVIIIPEGDGKWFREFMRQGRRDPSGLISFEMDRLTHEPIVEEGLLVYEKDKWGAVTRKILSEVPARGYKLLGTQLGPFGESRCSGYHGYVGVVYDALASQGILPRLKVDGKACEKIDKAYRRFYKP